ncbi:MAG TPA: 16S rRNA pseudouridine(516) synthase RsuA [Pseudohongiella sp.]|nr:16S rRNA pseudouridine(516) synthase RsuA [Pseudohongiella sp.]HDZ08599.1 16S rRNA pseudouridine(516) synthase RsuA [Pseudohongiella sp.]HEA64071.1 16S rRNA pseudouridine(516) synthase RsuA [Pseudohongiella sp.]
MRLDKFLAHATELSRELARRALRGKRVTVNDEVVKSASLSITIEDTVMLDDEVVEIRGPRYFMLYKPEGYVCATTDGDYPTVLDLMGFDGDDLSIAGRLDKDTTGLVLLSDDGQWVHSIISPRRECMKTYVAELDAPIDEAIVQRFSEGFTLRNEVKPTRPAMLRSLQGQQVEVSIGEGRYHQVKRMFAACGRHVEKLHRIKVGGIELDTALAPGEYRALTRAEIGDVSS